MKMNRALHPILSIVWCTLIPLFAGNAYAQVIRPVVTIQDSYNEKYAVFTDRSMYIAGEKLHFAVFNLSEKELASTYRSKVYYMELTKSDGTFIAGAKFPLSSKGAEGDFHIPENIATGFYFLRSYTRWMRNFSPADFACNRIKIINPNLQEIDNPVSDTSDHSNVFIPEDTSADIPVPVGCKTDKTTYGTREKVVVSIEIPSFLKNVSERFCITVTRPGAVDTNKADRVRIDEATEGNSYALHYIPEAQGLSLSGKILFKDNSEAAGNVFVQLAVLGGIGDYLSYTTGPDGKFYFSLLPVTGQQDLFITARNATDDQLEIHIDKDFANHYNALYPGLFSLHEEERDLAVEMMINSQVNKAFAEKIDPAISPSGQDSTGRCFYGKPLKIVIVDEYVALPTLGEVFFELVSEVNIGKRKDIPYLILTGNVKINAALASYSPLILLDRVPVSNLKDLLEVPPGKIQRIELLNELYVKGNVIYGGIVSIFSKKGDLAGINLPRNSFFFDYSGYYPQDSVEFKKYTDLSGDKRIPDFRNCLYWNPEIYIKAGDKASLEFYTSDNRGDFEVVVRGMTSMGKVLEKRCRFTVK